MSRPPRHHKSRTDGLWRTCVVSHDSSDRPQEDSRKAVDRLLEISVAGSFSRVGFGLRRCLEGWGDPGGLEGKTMIVTRASSGIGQAVAVNWLPWVRSMARWTEPNTHERASRAAEQAGGYGRVHAAQVDVVNADAVTSFVDRVSSRHTELHALIHNAGALFPNYSVADDGRNADRTNIGHSRAGPVRLTWLLAPLLLRAEQPVITIVTSGGMYAQRFDPDQIEAGPQATAERSPTLGPNGRRLFVARMGASLGQAKDLRATPSIRAG